MRRAVFPGSFDPLTKGHENVVRRGLLLFDEIVVALGKHSEKRGMFSMAERLAFIEATFHDEPRVKVEAYEGLTFAFCHKVEACAMLRGVRNAQDLAYEQTIAQMTRAMAPSLDTVILLTDAEFAPIHSTVVRDLLTHGGDASAFLPRAVHHMLSENNR
ncbi:MAG: pantetheine-phosphate adenylyltransferase [Bacteroidetes bacterium]|nr:pantetheine-phosphate adenylyltransferase [Bacteroidota bacterium]MDA0903234.1 pantetheine-phosphate adenylyltransferase [Bacteroidota bacterium]MDA1242207.1 pantetheine-phosphate adenylyltransferase [Bacteroidota bacterium]